MEGQVWRIVEALLQGAQPPSGRFRFSDAEILRVVLWAVLHDRPMVWACRPEHWSGRWRPARLPHASTISRRWRSSALHAAEREPGGPASATASIAVAATAPKRRRSTADALADWN